MFLSMWNAVRPDCAILERFWVQILLQKRPQIIDNFLGYFKKHYFLSKNNYGSFLGKLGLENWATFHSNIWSH